MRSWLILFFSFGHFVSIIVHAQNVAGETCQPESFVIKAGRVWTGDTFLGRTDILIEAGRISALSQDGTLPLPSGTQIILALNETVLPGLIDGHAHMFEKGGAMSPSDLVAPFESSFPLNGRQMLQAGVTSARIHLFDLAHGPKLKRLAENPCYSSPRLTFAGPGFIGGAPGLERTQVWGAKSPSDARGKVQQIKQAGATWIAIHNVGSFLPEILFAICDEARRAGLRIMAGGESGDEIQQLLKLEVDTIEYLDNSPSQFYSALLLQELAAAGRPPVFVTPIGYYYRIMSYIKDPQSVNYGLVQELLPPKEFGELRTNFQALLSEPDINLVDLVQAFPTFKKKFLQLRNAGLLMAIGTDCGSPGNFHFDAIWWELKTWRDLGVPIEDILKSATSVSATLMDKANIGKIVPRAFADLVIYSGDLSKNTTPLDVSRVQTVIKNGVFFLKDGKWLGP